MPASKHELDGFADAFESLVTRSLRVLSKGRFEDVAYEQSTTATAELDGGYSVDGDRGFTLRLRAPQGSAGGDVGRKKEQDGRVRFSLSTSITVSKDKISTSPP